MLVSELKDSLQGRTEQIVHTELGNMEVSDDASMLKLKDSGRLFAFDPQAESALAVYLGVNKSYLAKCPDELKAYNLNYWLQRKPEAPTIIETFGDSLLTVHKPGLLLLPISKVAEIIERVFEPTHEIVNLIRDSKTFHIDITTDHHVEVPVDERIEGRKEVGDITRGGVRIIASPTEVKAPKVMTYLHRLVCTNGLCSDVEAGTISLKGNTVETLLQEMEIAAQQALSGLDDKLAEYAALADIAPPGSPSRFAYQIGREHGLTQTTMDRVVDHVNVLPDDASMYDVLQVFTQLANGNVNYRAMNKLQGLGGEMAFATEHVMHRCNTCERLLPEN